MNERSRIIPPVCGMKKTIPSWILWTVIGLLLATDLILTISAGWQYRENERLRRELLALAQVPPARASLEDATRVADAARLGQLELLRSILGQHPELLNVRTVRNDSTPLHHAVFYRRDAIVKELLRRKADVHATNSAGLTPLHDCIHRGTIEAAVMLLDHGANITVRNSAGQTPLAYALAKNRSDMAELLQQRGAQQ
jgi:ankyrin repeat protein